jgi:subfamily B ATP-binding cassette protein MsbA
MNFSLRDIAASAGVPLLRRCLIAFKPYWKAVALASLSMGVVAACTAAAAFLVKPALDDIFIEKNERALYLIPLAYVLVVVVKGVFQYLQNLLMKRSGLLVLEDLRNALYDKIIGLPLSFFEENQVGMLMSRIINDVLLIRMSLPAVVMLVRQILTMVGLVFVVFYRDWRLACWAMLVLPLAIYPFFYFARKLRKYSRRNQSQLADIASVLQEIFSGIRVVKAFATEPVERARFNRENDRLVKIAIKEIIFSELSSRIMELIGAIGMGLVIWYGGFKVITGESTPGSFFSFMAALIMLYEPLKKLDGANADIARALAGAERVFEVLDSPELKIEQDGELALDLPFAELEFRNVTFGYESSVTPVLENIDLRVAAGERVAIVGPSGAGKTTLVNMIPRFYLPQQGEIRVNGRPLNEYKLSSLRRRVGMVSQESFLFNASVAENVAYGEPVVEMPAVEAACRAAYAHEFVLELPEGYETVVGERGVKLSGGQKQRLTIARALLKNPPLLILDEATSALDTESERIVQLALENLMRSRTSVVIAHRLSTVLNADRIVVMERGRIAAQGAHAELLTCCALYARLYEMQFRDESQNGAVGA